MTPEQQFACICQEAKNLTGVSRHICRIAIVHEAYIDTNEILVDIKYFEKKYNNMVFNGTGVTDIRTNILCVIHELFLN